MFINVLIVLWSWNITDSYDQWELVSETWNLQVQNVIIQNIIWLQVVLYHIFYSLTWSHSIFEKNTLLIVEHHSCHIMRAHFLEHDQMSQLQIYIQDSDQSEQELRQSWIASLSH